MHNVEQIIAKWQRLQRLIKEEITLSKIISEAQRTQAEKCQDWYHDYYQTKIQIDYQLKEKEFVLHRNTDAILDDAYNPIYELLMRFRQDNNLIILLIDIIEKKHYIRQSSIIDLIQFFCFSFHEDLLTSYNHEAELSLIHKMIDREVAGITTLKPSCFINDSTSFLGKFLTYYASKQDYKHFSSLIFGGVILKIKQYDKTFELNPRRIIENITRQTDMRDLKASCFNVSHSRLSVAEEISNKSLTKSIKKSSFNVDRNKLKLGVSYKLGDDIFFQIKSNSNNIIFNTLEQIDEEHKMLVFNENNDYQIELTEDELIARITNKATNKELKQMYANHIGLDNDYTNRVL